MTSSSDRMKAAVSKTYASAGTISSVQTVAHEMVLRAAAQRDELAGRLRGAKHAASRAETSIIESQGEMEKLQKEREPTIQSARRLAIKAFLQLLPSLGGRFLLAPFNG